jgi:5-methylcytosine-specific restriction protein A
MTRALAEWIGKTADSAVPPRVRLRIFQRFDGCCQCGCGRKIAVGERWDCEDAVALVNGGERRESNLRPFLTEHHKPKTADDVAIKSKTYRMARRHAGVKRPRTITRWRRFDKTPVIAPRER